MWIRCNIYAHKGKGGLSIKKHAQLQMEQIQTGQILVCRNVNDKAVTSLCDTLPAQRKLQSLRLKGCTFTARQFNALLSYLKSSTITELRVYYQPAALQWLENPPVAAFEYLTSLWLDCVVVNANVLSVILAQQLVILHLSSAGITDTLVQLIGNNLQQPTSNITELGLCGNFISDDGVAAFATNTRLRNLCLCGNKVGDRGIRVLAHMLQKNVSATLHTLTLTGNTFGLPGLSHLAAALRQNRSLHRLVLNKLNITDHGAALLARHLIHNKTLSSLIVNNNAITDAGLLALLKIFSFATPLNQLWCNQNQITLAGLEYVEDVWEKIPNLHCLGLASNHFTRIVPNIGPTKTGRILFLGPLVHDSVGAYFRA